MTCWTCKHRRISGIKSFGLCDPLVKAIGAVADRTTFEGTPDTACRFWVSREKEAEYTEEEL